MQPRTDQCKVKINLWSDILDLCKLPVCYKARQVLLESGLCVILEVKPKGRVHKSPNIWMCVLALLCYPLVAAYVVLLHPLSLEQWHRSQLVMCCICCWPKETKISNGPTLIFMELYNRVIISQPGGISSLPGCAQGTWLCWKTSHQFHDFSV
jgi:hypothetical protein